MENSRQNDRRCDEDATAHKLTLRDPDGSLYFLNGRFIRSVHNHRADDYRSILAAPSVLELVDTKRCVSSTEIKNNVAPLMLGLPTHSYLLEHPAVRFPSYPHEWSAQMLRKAGLLTLEIAERVFKDRLGLKDASPFNILFDDANPILVDALSFERRKETNPLWLPYSQFMENFINPLIIHNLTSIPIHELFLTHPHGVKCDAALKYLNGFKKFHPMALSCLVLPQLFGRLVGNRSLSMTKEYDPRQARFILSALFRQLHRSLDRTERNHQTNWTRYGDAPESYTADQRAEKKRWMQEIFEKISPKRLLDIGCNTGEYSIMAANAGATVTAIDSDSTVIDQLWRRSHEGGLKILPLVVNIAQPSPSLGWRNRQSRSFIERCQRSRHDTVTMLALLHHLMVSELIPLDEIITLARDLTDRFWIVELVLPHDRMFARMARGRTIPISENTFEAQALDRFTLVQKRPISGSQRILYCWEKRP